MDRSLRQRPCCGGVLSTRPLSGPVRLHPAEWRAAGRMRSGHAMLAMLLTTALTSHASIHRHGQRPIIASGLTRRSLFATVESGAPAPLAGGRMQPKVKNTNTCRPACGRKHPNTTRLVLYFVSIQTCMFLCNKPPATSSAKVAIRLQLHGCCNSAAVPPRLLQLHSCYATR